MIRIRDITIAELKSFIESPEYKSMAEIPISRHRAISHFKNPLAKADDKILFLAYEDDKFVGYLGAMPDELLFNSNIIRVAWLSCMWVDSSQRGKGIAPILLSHAHKSWDGNLLITNFIPLAKRAYDKTGLYTEFKNLPGVRGYLRFNLAEIFAAKKPVFQKFRWLLKTVDGGLNIINEVRLLRWKFKYILKDISFEYVNNIDDEILELIKRQSLKHLTPKNYENFHWLMQFPWILNAPFSDRNSKRYSFSSVKPDFRQYFIKIYSSDSKLIAFIVLTIRDSLLKTPYLYFEEKNIQPVMKLIYAHALHSKVKTITTYHPLISSYILASTNPFILRRKMNFRILISKNLKEKLANTHDYYFMEGDGDAAFV